MFVPGVSYTRRDIFRTLGVPENTWGGNWFTGYNEHQGSFYIFANVGSPGRTGHDYGNTWVGDQLRWFAKTGTRLTHPQIQRLINPATPIHIFWRPHNEEPFIYAGRGRAAIVEDTTPVEVLWDFPHLDAPLASPTPQEVTPGRYREGSTRQITVNAYERNPAAQRDCIDHYGARCQVCDLSFEERYGDVGQGYIHVHHLLPLHTIPSEYEVDPIQDLRPVCPNCHAMLHRTEPPLAIDQLRVKIRR